VPVSVIGTRGDTLCGAGGRRERCAQGEPHGEPHSVNARDRRLSPRNAGSRGSESLQPGWREHNGRGGFVHSVWIEAICSSVNCVDGEVADGALAGTACRAPTVENDRTEITERLNAPQSTVGELAHTEWPLLICTAALDEAKSLFDGSRGRVRLGLRELRAATRRKLCGIE
jgi:hypothetical protein